MKQKVRRWGGVSFILALLALFFSRNSFEQSYPAAEPVPTLDDVRTVLGQFANEPTVQELQEVAMRFAEVHPDKIEAWRRGAKWRGLVPDLEVSFSRDIGKSYSEGERFDSGTRSDVGGGGETDQQALSGLIARSLTLVSDGGGAILTGYLGPITGDAFFAGQWTALREYSRAHTDQRQFTERRESTDERERTDVYEIAFSWELGDFLFNPDEVRISDETRDLVELRNEVLQEVTQIYYQRRNLQVDLILSPPEDLRERMRMEVQLSELTANLDYLTGGWLTHRVNEARYGKGEPAKSAFIRSLLK